jgi:hypothetical protein
VSKNWATSFSDRTDTWECRVKNQTVNPNRKIIRKYFQKNIRDKNKNKNELSLTGKRPSAKGRVPKTIMMVDPNDWAVALEDPSKNTTECCQVCSIAEGIAQAENGIGTTGLGQVCSCQWKIRY